MLRNPLPHTGFFLPSHIPAPDEWAVSRRKLFGMPASEKAILKYFKQDAQPLFTEGEIMDSVPVALLNLIPMFYGKINQVGVKDLPHLLLCERLLPT